MYKPYYKIILENLRSKSNKQDVVDGTGLSRITASRYLKMMFDDRLINKFKSNDYRVPYLYMISATGRKWLKNETNNP